MPTHYQGTPREEQILNTWIILSRATESIDRYLRHGLDNHKLTAPQFAVLEMLYHLGPLCQSAIGKKMLWSGGNVTKVIDNLERDGWVKRIQNPEDRRFYQVHLTQAGKKQIESIFPDHLTRLKDIFSVLGESCLETMIKNGKKLGFRATELQTPKEA